MEAAQIQSAPTRDLEDRLADIRGEAARDAAGIALATTQEELAIYNELEIRAGETRQVRRAQQHKARWSAERRAQDVAAVKVVTRCTWVGILADGQEVDLGSYELPGLVEAEVEVTERR